MDPYEIVLGRQRAVGAPTGLANPAVRGILEESEQPGTFEQFFRFLGRPGFATRSLMAGDLAGVGRNTAQFLNEIFLGGMGALNPNWTLTGALRNLPGLEGLPTDFTSREDRPEFTDLLKDWGVADPRYMGFMEKLAYDVVGGIFTDPLSLVGGAPKGVTATSLKLATGPNRRIAMQRAAYVGVRQGGGKANNAVLDVFENNEIQETAKRLAMPRTEPKWGVVSDVPSIEGDLALARSRIPDPYEFENRRRIVDETATHRENAERWLERIRGERDAGLAAYESEAPILRLLENPGFDDLVPPAALLPEEVEAIGALAPGERAEHLRQMLLGGQRLLPEDARALEGMLRDEVAGAVQNINWYRGGVERAAAREQEALAGYRNLVEQQRSAEEVVGNVQSRLDRARQAAATPGATGPSKLTAARALSQFNSQNLGDFVRRAPEFGITQRKASQIVLGIQNRAAEKMFFENVAKAGVDMTRATRTLTSADNAVAAFFDSNTPNALLELPLHDRRYLGTAPDYPDLVKDGVRSGALGAMEVPGQQKMVFFHPRQRLQAQALVDNYQALSDGMALGLPPAALARMRRDIGMKLGYSDEAIKAELATLYGQEIADQTVTGLETWKRFLEETPDSVLNAGIKALREKGMTGDGVSYYNPLKGEFRTIGWDAIFGPTLPGLVMKGLRAKFPGAADQVTEWTTGIAGLVMNRIYSKLHRTGGVDPHFEAKARGINYQSFVNASMHRDQTIRTFITKLAPEERGEMARQIDIAGDTYQAAIVRGDHLAPDIQEEARRRVAVLLGVEVDDLPGAARGGPIEVTRRPGGNTEITGLRDSSLSRRAPEMLRQMSEKILADRHMDALRAELATVLPNPSVAEALEAWRKGMSQIPPYMRFGAKWEDDLKNFAPNARQAWEDALENPFYLPHQMSPRLHQMLDEGVFDTVTAGRINDVFSGTRNYRTRKEFLQVLEGLADDVGLELDDGIESLQQLDLAELYYRRMVSFEITKARQALYQEAQKTMVARGGGIASDYRFYINRVLHPTAALDWSTGEVLPGGGARKNFFSKLLGGGTFTIPIETKSSAEKWTKGFLAGWGARVVNKNGRWGVAFRFPGFNAVYKPLLTSHPLNPKFRFRNIFSSALMMQFVPGIGPEGFKQIIPAVFDDGLVRVLFKSYDDAGGIKNRLKRAAIGPAAPLPQATGAQISKGDYTNAVMRFLLGTTQAEKDAAFELLRRSGTTIGPYSWDQAGPALRMIMGASGGVSPADLSGGVEMVPRMLEGVSSLSLTTRGNEAKIGPVRQAFRDYVANGERLSNEIEARFRATAMLALLAKGVDPYQAAKQVGDAFVDYSKQSVVERGLRDFFPFARFMIGSTAWAKGMVEKPGAALPAVMKGLSPLSASLITPQNLATAQRSATFETQDEAGGGAFLPGETANTIALPLPWRDKEGNIQFLTSMGIPHEATIQIVGAPLGTESARKVIGGGLQPLVRLPAEAMTGRSFFFGTDFGSYRKAPAWAPLADEIPGRHGKEPTREIRGIWNELINASPLSNPASLIDKVLDQRREWWNKLLVTSTGFKITSVDLEREVKRRVADYLQSKVDSGQIGEVQAFFLRMDSNAVPEDLKIMLDSIAQQRATDRKENDQKKGRGLGY